MRRAARTRFVRGIVPFLTLAAICLIGLQSWAQTQGQAGAQNQPAGPGGTAPAASATPAAPANQSAASQKSAEFQPRLPSYYGKVVDEKQRETIYEIQRKYYPQIAELQRQLKKLTAQRDAEIEAVLSPQQKAEIEKLRGEAAGRRAAKAAKTDSAAGDAGGR